MSDQLVEFIGNHQILVMAFAALLSFTLYNEYRIATRRFPNLSPAMAVKMMNEDEDFVVLDVREASETANGKITNAIQIPVGSVVKRIGEIEQHKEKPVLVYCRTGARSAIACNHLTKAGFTKVYNLAGGITAWIDDHLPTSKK